MTLAKIALRYEHCSHHELRHFLQSRSHLSVAADCNLYFYITKLRQLDENETFRFLDLPPELRNAIYEHLLLPRPSSQDPRKLDRDLAILATSQQLCAEGEGILYSDVEFRIRLTVGRNQVKLTIKEPSRHISNATIGREHLEVYRLWPESVAKMRRAEVMVISHGVTVEAGHPFEIIWKQLFDSVCGARELKGLKLRFAVTSDGKEGFVGECLENVTELPKLEKVEVNGRSFEVGDELRSVIDSRREGHDALDV